MRHRTSYSIWAPAASSCRAMPAAPATAALVRNLRRVDVEEFLFWLISITLPWIDLFF